MERFDRLFAAGARPPMEGSVTFWYLTADWALKNSDPAVLRRAIKGFEAFRETGGEKIEVAMKQFQHALTELESKR